MENSQLNWWTPNDPVGNDGVRVLIGVATYSGPELQLLDRLHEFISSNLNRNIPTFDVFDMFGTSSNFQQYIPGSSPIETPVLGVWESGDFVEMVSGRAVFDYSKKWQLEVTGAQKAEQGVPPKSDRAGG